MKMKKIFGLGRGLAAALVLGTAGQAVRAQASQPSLDELLEIAPAEPARPAPPTAAPREESQSVTIDPEVARRLTGQQAADLFHRAVAEMTEASERLGRQLDPGAQTQRVQEGVLAKLDQVIAAAEQQSSQGGGKSSSSHPQKQESGSAKNAGQQPGGPAAQEPQAGPSATGGQAPLGGKEAGANRPLEETKNEWGNLPPRLRDELRQGQDERFSPVYRDLTERYYRSLAEEGK